jgi:hypothetical protein
MNSPTPETIDVVSLREAVLDEAGVDALFTDLAMAATLLGVTTKGGARTRAVDGAGDPRRELDAARAALRAGTIAGVQVRYVHAERQWWDTLLRVPGGVRLVRICHDDALRGEP